ncbi:MAG: sigma 54-interacting transcriptional regulator [Verrucomicrobia bacterium]|nr:sigma 54-interacting transcriptional regulator [Verrucomicrobiota bacterium]MCH8527071.1 sigma 54-interacting transcriptional regulator [Kiritimatiellia bacterium]
MKKINEQRSLKDLEFVTEIAHILERSLDVREIVNPIMDAMTRHLGMKHATITLLNRKTNDILIDAAHGLTPQQARRGRYKLGEGVTGQVIESGEPIQVERTSESPLFLNRTQRFGAQESSFICVPIKTGKTVVGALSADRPFDETVDLEADMAIMEIVASLLAQSVRLRRSAQERGEKLESENERLRAELKDRFRPSNIIGNSHEMQIVYDQIAQVSKSQTSVLIEGETGTGKELVAHAIHYNSDRADKPFIKAHCAALPENLIESELFGHVKGSFTGATTDRKGRFEMADGGTLFLDEIGEIPPSIQIKLLRVLQEREFERVGDTKTTKVNVRVIAATNRNLQQMAAEGTFREDLFYRLHVFPIYVPPLRKRKSDVLQLADFFLEKYSKSSGKHVRRLSSPVIDMLYSYHWPGNVRELENIIERGVILAEGDALHPHHLPPTLQTAEQVGTPPKGSLKSLVETYERDLISDALKSARGNMAQAARSLEATQRIFGYKVHKYNINPKQYAG